MSLANQLPIQRIVTYVVSALDRPLALRCCLASLQCQDDPDWECFVADNSRDQCNQAIVEGFKDQRIRHVDTGSVATSPGWDCYWSAEHVVQHYATGAYLVFPSDDTYYMPVFQSALLAAASTYDLSLIYPEMIYDRRIGGRYGILDTSAQRYRIDKTGFMLRRDAWIGFPDKSTSPGPVDADGLMIDRLMHGEIRHGKVNEILVVHN